ncbi:dTMP kinase [Aeromicrobium alkaliterrae]|uniref:Thymidylate kinase n=1 Tax=Aeromicrobium alkaliterrae TaxID=302168 RepID=A0ABN2K4H3_9ACTN
MPSDLGSGFFLVLEGGEGGGKSTQAARAVEWLRAAGRTVVQTRQPGGTPVGLRLREILLSPETGTLDPRTESLVYAADKAEHVATVISPALERGEVVVCDRYVDSTLAYQGAGRAIDADELARVAAWATDDLRPHLTVVLDVDPEVGLVRAGRAGDGHDRIEAEPLEFHRRVRQHFLDLAAARPDEYLVVDADRDPAVVHAEIRAALEARLSQVGPG